MPRSSHQLPSSFDDTAAKLQADFIERLTGLATTTTTSNPALTNQVSERLRSIEESLVSAVAGVRQQIGGGGVVQVVVAAAVPPGVAAPAAALAAPSASSSDVAGWKIWKHADGGFKNVPPGFVLPGRGNSVQDCFKLWMLGDRTLGIRPFRALSTKDFGQYEVSPTGRKLIRTAMTRRYCEWKKLFEYLLDAVPASMKVYLTDPTEAQVEEMWNAVKHLLYDNVKTADTTTEGAKHKKKVEAQSVYTAYEYAFKKRKHGGEAGAAPPGNHLIRRRKRLKDEEGASGASAAAAAPAMPVAAPPASVGGLTPAPAPAPAPATDGGRRGRGKASA